MKIKLSGMWIEGINEQPCVDAITWLEQQETQDLYELYELAKDARKFIWCDWYISRALNEEQQIQYKKFAAKLAKKYIAAAAAYANPAAYADADPTAYADATTKVIDYGLNLLTM